MLTELVIPLKLPSLNEYIDVCRRNKYAAAKYKADLENDISWFFARINPIKKPVKIHFMWYESSGRRDPDNVAAGGRKFILDALVKSGILKGDDYRYIKGFVDDFIYGKEQKVRIIFIEKGVNDD